MNVFPNILLIHVDQMRGDCLSLCGHPVVQTPNLDFLAQSGAHFRAAYSECPICIPARHTLLTGMEPNATGVTGYSTRARIARPEATLPELLRQHGYQTVHVGRGWHQYPKHCHYGFEIMDNDPFMEHYSRFHHLSVPGSNHMARVNWPHGAIHGIGGSSICARPWPHEEEFHQTNFAVNKAMEFIYRRDRERPFFLSLGIVAPHPPLVPPACYYERYINGEIDEPAIGDWAVRPENNGRGIDPCAGRQVLEGNLLREAKAGYYGLINHLDDQLQLLLTCIRHEGELFVFFVSDHGESLGDHYLWRKSVPYEGSTRIPFLLSGPEIPSGVKVDAPVGLQDILPTCCEIAEIDVPSHVTGASVLGLARGNTSTAPREWIHGEHGRQDGIFRGMHYLTDGQRKFIWLNDGTEQFFNLEEDPRELYNLVEASAWQDEVKMWRQRLIQKLEGRPENFTDGSQLLPGRLHTEHNSLAKVD